MNAQYSRLGAAFFFLKRPRLAHRAGRANQLIPGSRGEGWAKKGGRPALRQLPGDSPHTGDVGRQERIPAQSVDLKIHETGTRQRAL